MVGRASRQGRGAEGNGGGGWNRRDAEESSRRSFELEVRQESIRCRIFVIDTFFFEWGGKVYTPFPRSGVIGTATSFHQY